MKRITKVSLLGLSALVPMLMAPSGGFPSRPTFQKVTITGNGSAGSENIFLNNTRPWIGFNETDAAANSRYWDIQAQGQTLEFDAFNDALGAASTFFSTTRSGTTITAVAIGNSTDKPSVTINGNGVPLYSFGEFTANGSGCALNSGVVQSRNISGCVRNSAGNYTISFTTAYSGSPAPPVCVTAGQSPTVGFASINTTSSTSTTVQEVNTSFVAADNGQFYLYCIGNQ